MEWKMLHCKQDGFAAVKQQCGLKEIERMDTVFVAGENTLATATMWPGKQ